MDGVLNVFSFNRRTRAKDDKPMVSKNVLFSFELTAKYMDDDSGVLLDELFRRKMHVCL